MTLDAQPTDVVTNHTRWRQRRWQLLAIALLLGGAFGVYRTWFTTKAAPIAAPQQVKVTRGALATTLTTSGTAAAGLSAKVGFQTASTVTSISVIVGQTVTAGQELARVDNRDATLRLQTAQASLDAARTRLAQLQAPAVAADRAASAASVASATSALANAQAAYDQLLSPTTTDIAAADATVAQAQASLATARTNVDTNWAALVSAQNQYCFLNSISIGYVCVVDQLPLSASAAADITASIRLASGNATWLQRTTGLLQANTTYVNSKQTLDASQAAYNSAKAKRDSLGTPSPSDVSQARASLAAAQANLASAQAKQQALTDGATSFDLDLQRASVRQAEIAVQQAGQTLDNTMLRAPFSGQVAAIVFNLGEQSGAGTITINDPSAVRVDLTVSETDLPSLKVDQVGLASFDALSGQQVVVRVRGISTLPTVAQGVVTYPVQTEILTGQALADARAQLQTILKNAGSRGASGGAGGPQAGGSPQASPSASATTNPSGTPTAGASATPTGTFTPGGQGGQRGQSGQATPGDGAPATPGGTPGQGGARGAGGGTGGGFGGGAPTPARVAPGMNASITLLLQVQESVLLLPTAAVHRQGRQSFVTVPDGTKTKEIPIVVGGTDGKNVIIVSGLDEGATALIGVTPATGASAASRSATPAAPIGGGGGGFGGGGVR